MIRTTIELKGQPIQVSKDGVWRVQVAGRSASSPYLDVALEEALPDLRQFDRDRVQIRLLLWAAGRPAEEHALRTA